MSKNSKIFYSLIFLLAFQFSQDSGILINKIKINGLLTVTDDQVFRSSGLYPSEEFIDLNSNNMFDINESYIDINNNNNYDYGTYFRKGNEINIAIKNLWSYGVFSNIQVFAENVSTSKSDLSDSLSYIK